jgi:hypothetical protein
MAVDASLTMVIAMFQLGHSYGRIADCPGNVERLSISRLRKQVDTLCAENDYLCEQKKNSPSAVCDLLQEISENGILSQSSLKLNI